jgi:hypothetical protein
MQNDAGGVDNRSQTLEEAFSKRLLQNGFHLFGADIEAVIGAASNLSSNGIEYLLDFGNHKFAAGTLDPGYNGGAEQKLIHRRDLSKEVLLVGCVHGGISTQRLQAVNVRGYGMQLERVHSPEHANELRGMQTCINAKQLLRHPKKQPRIAQISLIQYCRDL